MQYTHCIFYLYLLYITYIMEVANLVSLHHVYQRRFKSEFNRQLDIEWKDQLIGLTGARGVGKTTWLLNYIKTKLKNSPSVLYASVDDIFFSHTRLIDLADHWIKMGGTHLFLDEIHKYPNWSQELKNIYDRYHELKVIFTGSSLLHINHGNADLSRRAVIYTMNGLSFREYVNIETGEKFERLTLQDVLSHHNEFAREINSRIKPLAQFERYIRCGYYPYYRESELSYHKKLLATLNLILEVDLPYLRHVEVRYVHKLKKLLYLVAHAVPYQVNVSKLSADMEVSRNTVMLYLNYLQDGRLLNLLHSKNSSDAILAKPEKVYLHHPNLLYAIAGEHANKGSARETFFYNQVGNVYHVQASPIGDFLVDGIHLFETGGKTKSRKQLKQAPDAWVVADGIEYGFGKQIPLWMFGFLS